MFTLVALLMSMTDPACVLTLSGREEVSCLAQGRTGPSNWDSACEPLEMTDAASDGT